MLNSLTVYSTGNNIRFTGDMPRRAVISRMDANMERPELRTFETQPHKLILADRGRYVADCLTIHLAYRLAGSPGKLMPQLGSFEEWSDLVRSALVWLGCADPIETVGTTDNPGREQAAALFAAWPQGQTSYSTAELIEIAEQRGGSTDLLHPELLSALQPIGKDRRGSLDVGTLGTWLRDHKDTVIGTLKLTRHGTKTRPSWGVGRP